MNKKSLWTFILNIFLLTALMISSACTDDDKASAETKKESDVVRTEQPKAIDNNKQEEVILQDVTGLYKELPSHQPTTTGNKIEVVEVFWYGCPHCYQFEPFVEKWLEEKAGYIEFIRMPGVLGENWLPHARAFYVAEKLGVTDKIHGPLFNAIHKEKQKIMDKRALRSFFVEQGVSGDDFDQAWQSKEVEENVRYAYTMGQRYVLTGVPAVIINGKYGTSASMAGDFNKIIDVVNTLAAKEYGKLNQ